MSTNDARRTLTVEELAPILGVSAISVYRAIGRGQCPIPVIRLGTRILIPRVALEAVLLGEMKLTPGGDRDAA